MRCHRIQIGRIQRREVPILHLDHHVEIFLLHDPLRAQRRWGSRLWIQPEQIVLRLVRRRLLRHQNVAMEGVTQIPQRDIPGSHLVVASRHQRRNRLFITVFSLRIFDALPVRLILRREFQVEPLLGNVSRTSPEAFYINRRGTTLA